MPAKQVQTPAPAAPAPMPKPEGDSNNKKRKAEDSGAPKEKSTESGAAQGEGAGPGPSKKKKNNKKKGGAKEGKDGKPAAPDQGTAPSVLCQKELSVKDRYVVCWWFTVVVFLTFSLLIYSNDARFEVCQV